MFCQKCGTENPEDAVFCISCGDQLKKVTENNSEPVVNLEKKNDGPENVKQSFVPNQSKINYEGEQVRSPLIWSILVTVFGFITCCCLNPVSAVVGIIAIVFSTQVDDKQRRGDIEGAKNAAKNAIILNWVGLGFMILTIIIWILLVALGAISSDDYTRI